VSCNGSFAEATRCWSQGYDKKCSCKWGSTTFTWRRWKDGGLDWLPLLFFWEFWNLRLVKISISWSIEFCVVAGMVH
jgi:hypothetical protein